MRMKKIVTMYALSGNAGAPEIADGVAPAAKVVNKGEVGAEGSPEVIEAKGTAVGLVDKRETGTVVREEIVGVAPGAEEDEE